MKYFHLKLLLALIIVISFGTVVHADEGETLPGKEISGKQLGLEKLPLPDKIQRFLYDSGLDFTYPDAVRGIYVTANSAAGDRMSELKELVGSTDLNAMVIDVKEDHGNIMLEPHNDKYKEMFEGRYKSVMDDPRAILEDLEERGIYPIARVVVFKDNVLAEERPDLSFKRNGEVWTNGKGEAFVNPFEKEVWEYNAEVGKMAAELGFKEIQFDYVRFPEGFASRDDTLDYGKGEYDVEGVNDVQERVNAVTDFVEYARKSLRNYDVEVSVDIFGYSALVPEEPNIGQNFSKISSNVDVISSMIYPSHWGPSFGLSKPDTQPYKLIDEYAQVENERLQTLEDPPTSRPWIQDFEAPWLYSGATKQYGKQEVEAQIRALNENGIEEFLLWNAGNSYTKGVDYTP
ncbi:putative glycoside hydrolase [Salimicrobium flavidum]|uniref:DUF4015 domain-containing protein n=1 Tax=Salimicrobium flavidum TaxID=570947 RepID=A0A1N7JEK2_9BACI|nr:putative glycoside hydrolase [Salimicrobium flavidum]SIS47792.1 hypothetical protein SAMN05421687_105152 [Salimicrobium flavidum]